MRWWGGIFKCSERGERSHWSRKPHSFDSETSNRCKVAVEGSVSSDQGRTAPTSKHRAMFSESIRDYLDLTRVCSKVYHYMAATNDLVILWFRHFQRRSCWFRSAIAFDLPSRKRKRTKVSVTCLSLPATCSTASLPTDVKP